jgi:hypothetical protein
MLSASEVQFVGGRVEKVDKQVVSVINSASIFSHAEENIRIFEPRVGS